MHQNIVERDVQCTVVTDYNLLVHDRHKINQNSTNACLHRKENETWSWRARCSSQSYVCLVVRYVGLFWAQYPNTKQTKWCKPSPTQYPLPSPPQITCESEIERWLHREEVMLLVIWHTDRCGHLFSYLIYYKSIIEGILESSKVWQIYYNRSGCTSIRFPRTYYIP